MSVLGADYPHISLFSVDIQVLAEKIYRLSDNIACTVAGITADANILINHLRYWAAEYKLSYGEHIPVEQLVQTLCNEKQRYTQVGGIPFVFFFRSLYVYLLFF